MNKKFTKGEMHGCIVCGKLYHLYVVYAANGEFVGCKVMSAGGKCVPHPQRPLVACDHHTQASIEAAVTRVFGKLAESED